MSGTLVSVVLYGQFVAAMLLNVGITWHLHSNSRTGEYTVHVLADGFFPTNNPDYPADASPGEGIPTYRDLNK